MPGLRRLLDPRRRAAAHARARRAPRGHGVRVRHRLRRPLPVLHEHLRDARDPRPGAGDRHRPGDGPARPRRVGGHRRRRRAVDRRQPPDPRAAPQRQPHDPAVQQPDLRADEGPVLADERGRQGHEVDAVRLASTTRSTRCRWRSAPRRRFVARTHDMDRDHMLETFRRAHDHKGAAVRRDLPELQRLQRRRVRGDHRQGGRAPTCSSRCGTASRSASAPTASRASSLDAQGDVADRRRSPTSARTRILVHDETRDDPGARVHAVPARRAGRTSRRRSACSAPSSGRSTREGTSRQLAAAAGPEGAGRPRGLLRSGATWDV